MKLESVTASFDAKSEALHHYIPRSDWTRVLCCSQVITARQCIEAHVKNKDQYREHWQAKFNDAYYIQRCNPFVNARPDTVETPRKLFLSSRQKPRFRERRSDYLTLILITSSDSFPKHPRQSARALDSMPHANLSLEKAHVKTKQLILAVNHLMHVWTLVQVWTCKLFCPRDRKHLFRGSRFDCGSFAFQCESYWHASSQ